jgi:WD40 repeat protein/tRNA A-37 threonylcarbamoyl transferase component Bud32
MHSNPALPPSLPPTPGELAALLCVEQRRAWSAGRRVPVETYLERHPRLRADDDAVLDLIYNEVVLRENDPRPAARAELLERFPALAEPLQRLFDVHDAVAAANRSAQDTDGVSRLDLLDSTPYCPPFQEPHEEFAPVAAAQRIGGYEVLTEIGRGGMGIVYKARQPGTGRIVALKVILTGRFASEHEIARFQTEAQTAARLDHPGIVPIFEVGRAGDLYFLSMAFVEGETLGAALARGPLPPRRAAEVLRDVADAVQAAHRQGVVHRDLKPQNILIDPVGQVRITDFGLARQNDQLCTLTATGQVLGTPQYMAPEQAEGRADVGPAADIYALGATLYCALTGRPPFDGAVAIDVLNRVIGEEPVSPRLLNPAVGRDLDTICRKCLEKEPHRRYVSAEDLAADLRRFLSGAPIVARPIGRVGRLWRWCRRQPVLAGMTAAIVLLTTSLLVGSVVATVRLSSEQEQTLRHLGRARSAEQLANRRLLSALFTQVRYSRESDWAGHREQNLQAVRQAAPLLRELQAASPTPLELRNEAAVCLALTDVMSPQLIEVPDPGAVCFSADGTRAAWWDEAQHAVIVSDLSSASERQSIPFAGQSLSDLRLGPGARWLAARGMGHHRSVVLVWDLEQRDLVPLELAVSEGDVAGYDFAPAEPILALVTQSGALSVHDAVTGETRHTFSTSDAASGCRFSRDARRVAVWHGRDVHVFDVAEGRLITTFRHQPGVSIQSCDFAPDGTHVLTGSSSHEGLVWCVGPRSGSRCTLKGHKGWINDVAFAPDGNVAMTTCRLDETTRLWDPWSGRTLVVFDGYGRGFSADGRTILGTKGSALAAWDVVPNEVCRVLKGPEVKYPALQGDIDPAGRLLATCGWNDVSVHDLTTGEVVVELPVSEPVWVHFMRDGRLVTSSHAGFQAWTLGVDAGGAWSAATPESLALPGGMECAQCISGDAAGSVAVFGTYRGRVAPVDVLARDGPLFTHPRADRSALSADGRWLATFGRRASGVRVWNAADGQQVHTILPDRDDTMAAFSSDGTRLFAGAAGDYAVFDCGRWESRRLVAPGVLSHPLRNARFSPDGTLLAVADDHLQIKLLDADDLRELLTLPADHFDTALCFTPDSTRLVCMDELYGVRVWDLRTLQSQLDELGVGWNDE